VSLQIDAAGRDVSEIPEKVPGRVQLAAGPAAERRAQLRIEPAGLEAGIELPLDVVGLDCALYLVVVVRGFEAQPFRERVSLHPTSAVHHARRVAVGFLGLEIRIPSSEGLDLGVGLLEVGRHTLGRASGRELKGYRRVAAILECGGERRQSVQLADLRRAETG